MYRPDAWNVFQRQPDNERVYSSKALQEWEEAIAPGDEEEESKNTAAGQADDERIDHYVPKNGILDTLFEGLEEDIARVNKKLGFD